MSTTPTKGVHTMLFGRNNATSPENYDNKIAALKHRIDSTDAVVIGAGSGLSAAAGLLYSGQRFQRLFADYIEHYGFKDMYSAAFYPHKSLEEFWGYFSKHILYNRYEQDLNSTYSNILKLVENKNYFVITTNVDHIFQKSGFEKRRLLYTQGDYGLFQCSVPCTNETYDNEEIVRVMAEKQHDFKIPTELVPHCPKCGAPMTTNLRKDSTFVEDSGWHKAYGRYEDFIRKNSRSNVLFLEFGVGFNTPSIIKYPFWQMTYANENAFFACVNSSEAVCAKEIKNRAILIENDICEVACKLAEL